MQPISEQVLVINAGFGMLMDRLYKITDIRQEDDKVIAAIILNPAHDIFRGHYPGQPVLPGACMLQIVKDTLELSMHKKLMLKHASQMKFLSMIDPRENNQLMINLNISELNSELKVVGNLIAGNKPCFKFQGRFKQGL